MPDGKTLVVANGGIETHPETGRTKLNIPTMRPNLSYLGLDGGVEDQLELTAEHRRNSIRHLAVSKDGHVAFAMQWQGDLNEDLPLLGIHASRTGAFEFAKGAAIRRMHGYLGSVAMSPDGASIMTTSPRAGVAQVFHDADLVQEFRIADVCGVAASAAGFFLTSGAGLVKPARNQGAVHPIAWDNHLVPI